MFQVKASDADSNTGPDTDKQEDQILRTERPWSADAGASLRLHPGARYENLSIMETGAHRTDKPGMVSLETSAYPRPAMLSACMIIRNGLRLGYPFVEAALAVIRKVDELVVVDVERLYEEEDVIPFEGGHPKVIAHLVDTTVYDPAMGLELWTEACKDLEPMPDPAPAVPTPGTVQTNPLGFLVRSGTSDQRIFQDVFMANCYELPEELSAADVVVDIGAHTGSFTLAVARLGAGKVYAVEPDQANFMLAAENLGALVREGVVDLRRAAVWRSDRPVATVSLSAPARAVDLLSRQPASRRLYPTPWNGKVR